MAQWINYNTDNKKITQVQIKLSRCSTARGSCSGFSLGGPTNVSACKYFLFTGSYLTVENKIIIKIKVTKKLEHTVHQIKLIKVLPWAGSGWV